MIHSQRRHGPHHQYRQTKGDRAARAQRRRERLLERERAVRGAREQPEVQRGGADHEDEGEDLRWVRVCVSKGKREAGKGGEEGGRERGREEGRTADSKNVKNDV